MFPAYINRILLIEQEENNPHFFFGLKKTP